MRWLERGIVEPWGSLGHHVHDVALDRPSKVGVARDDSLFRSPVRQLGGVHTFQEDDGHDALQSGTGHEIGTSQAEQHIL